MRKYIPKLSSLAKYDKRFILWTVAAFSISLIVTFSLKLTGYYIQKAQIEKERDTALVVSASANQRMLSQRIALLSIALINAQSQTTRDRTRIALLNEISNMELTHQKLLVGDFQTGIKSEKSQEIIDIFYEPKVSLDHKVREFVTSARSLADSNSSELNSENPILYKLTEMSTELLVLFERLTTQYRNEGVDRILGLKTLATQLLFAELGLGILTALFIFYPIINRLKVEFFERSAFQNELVEQNKELELFSATVAHDLKAPLNNIGGFSKFLHFKLANQEDKESNEILDSIEAGVIRMTQMINELLQYAKLTTRDRKLERISLNEIIERVEKDFKKDIIDKKAVIKVEKLPSIIGNKIQIEHLFINLISNALKYKHSQREPIISIKQLDNQDNLDLVTIIIEDNGRGFPPGSESRMFEPFKRLNKDESVEGSGFGLALCKKVTKRHNGNIVAENVETGGARFIVTLSRTQ